MFWFGFYINALLTQPIHLATTDNLQKANEIQAEITNYRFPTVFSIDGSRYDIKILGGSKNVIDYAAVELADKGIITDNVSINSNVDVYKYFTNPKKTKKLEKLLNKSFSKRLSHIDGVYCAQTYIDIPENIIEFYQTPEPITAHVTLRTNKAFDIERITNTTKALLYASIPGLTKENIKINFEFEECDNECLAKTYYRQAKRAINIDKDYPKAMTNLQEAAKLGPEYKNSITDLKKIMELNEKINKSPSDYKLYIERGDIQNIEEISIFANQAYYITSNYEAAINDYNKALELNPKAYEVFEKLGDAYSETGWRKCNICKPERDIYDELNAIRYYKKAIEYLGGNDILYKKLGDRYLAAKDNKKANETFAKIKNPQALENNSIPKQEKIKFKLFN